MKYDAMKLDWKKYISFAGIILCLGCASIMLKDWLLPVSDEWIEHNVQHTTIRTRLNPPTDSPNHQNTKSTPITKPLLNPKSPPKIPQTWVIHVAGAVVTPGVYHINEGSRIVDAIQLAGGPTQFAHMDSLNLATMIQDSDYIYVPDYRVQTSNPRPSLATTKPLASSAKISLNGATNSDWQTIPGIGPALAKRIIETRQSLGSFKSIHDLVKVKGISDKKLAKIQHLIKH